MQHSMLDENDSIYEILYIELLPYFLLALLNVFHLCPLRPSAKEIADPIDGIAEVIWKVYLLSTLLLALLEYLLLRPH